MSNINEIGEFISLDVAKVWTQNFRDQNTGVIYAEMLGKDKIISLLQQEGCYGMRVYNAINDAGTYTIVITGVDSDGKDLTNGHLIGISKPCPPNCDIQSSLNNLSE